MEVWLSVSFIKATKALLLWVYGRVKFYHVSLYAAFWRLRNKSGGARIKSLILVFSARINCEKLMPVNISFLLFVHIVKLQVQKLKKSQVWVWKQLGKNGYRNFSVWNFGKGKSDIRSPRCSPACNLAASGFPPLGLTALTQHPTSGQGTARSLSLGLKSPSRVFEFRMIFIFFKECRVSWRKFYSNIMFNFS